MSGSQEKVTANNFHRTMPGHKQAIEIGYSLLTGYFVNFGMGALLGLQPAILLALIMNTMGTYFAGRVMGGAMPTFFSKPQTTKQDYQHMQGRGLGLAGGLAVTGISAIPFRHVDTPTGAALATTMTLGLATAVGVEQLLNRTYFELEPVQQPLLPVTAHPNGSAQSNDEEDLQDADFSVVGSPTSSHTVSFTSDVTTKDPSLIVLQSQELPMYKKGFEMFASFVTGYFITMAVGALAGAATFSGLSVAAYIALNAAPYLFGRVVDRLAGTYLSKPETTGKDYTHMAARSIGFLANVGMAALLQGATGNFGPLAAAAVRNATAFGIGFAVEKTVANFCPSVCIPALRA